jgi:hypothetical protein
VSDAAGNAGRKVRGRPFRKGESGNPAGKPKGCRNRAGLLLDAISDDDLQAIFAKLVEQAKAGDTTAAKLLLDRLLPVPRASAVTLDLPSLANGTARSKAAALVAVLDAVATGQLTPEEGEKMTALVTAAAVAVSNCGGLLPTKVQGASGPTLAGPRQLIQW